MFLLRSILTHSILFICVIGLQAQPFSEQANALYEEMSLEERIGQLFMIRAHSNLGDDHIKSVKQYIKKYKVGGLCFFQGDPLTQAKLANTYQDLSKYPLLVAMDAEWGLEMRFKKAPVVRYPRQLMLGAIQDNSLLYEMGERVANQLKRIGTHINFAPVVDINNNALNPVINDRSFGEDKYNVSSKGYMYMRGMQDNGLMACAKHFPGHGDTDVDSHHELPIIQHPIEHLENVELFPFHTLINQGLQSVMIAHLNVLAIDDRPQTPSSISELVIQELLQGQMGFEGLIFTDALEMQGIAKYYPNGQIELKAFLAGNDMLCLPNDLPLAAETLKAALNDGTISEERLKKSVLKILEAKLKAGLFDNAQVSIENLIDDINLPQDIILKDRLIENAITLVKDDENLVPIIRSKHNQIIHLQIGDPAGEAFQETLTRHEKVKRIAVSHAPNAAKKNEIHNELGPNDLLIISLHDLGRSARNNFGLDSSLIDWIHDLDKKSKVILNVFGNPYSLSNFDKLGSLLMAYEKDTDIERIAAEGLMGVYALKGKLPVSVSPNILYGDGLDRAGRYRLGMSHPLRVGMHPDTLALIDEMVQEIIANKAAPGCQILVAKNNRIVYNKSFGHHTYAKHVPVGIDHVYDLASITKIAASTMAVMQLYDQRKISLEVPLVQYLPQLKGSNKAYMNLMDIMSHHAGLIPWIPFYKGTINESLKFKPSKNYYRRVMESSFEIPVAKDLYLRSDFRDSIFQQVLDSDLRANKNYRYSDLAFYIVAELVKSITGQEIDDYIHENIYTKLGCEYTFYNAHLHYPKQKIAPTENDNYFRMQKIQGYVHDMGAAMLGGVSGHAGLYSNTTDLSKFGQMLLNGGSYAGVQYLEPGTIQRFAKRHPMSTRRGIGFDMRETDPEIEVNMSELASEEVFGHYGFTGTAIWMDPKHKLLYVFLSNRTYPSMNNNVMGKENYRSKLQSIIYRSFLKEEAT